MIVHFYRLDGAPADVPPLDDQLQLSWWSPERDGLPGRGSRRLVNYWWWVLSRLGGFSRPGFAELRIERGGRVLHRLIVTPRWYRFPFMAAGDLQIGDVWTADEMRRRGLARIGIAEAHRRFAGGGEAMWYVTDASNKASAAAALASGFRHVAVGRRTRPLGSALLGRYVIDRFI